MTQDFSISTRLIGRNQRLRTLPEINPRLFKFIIFLLARSKPCTYSFHIEYRAISYANEQRSTDVRDPYFRGFMTKNENEHTSVRLKVVPRHPRLIDLWLWIILHSHIRRVNTKTLYFFPSFLLSEFIFFIFFIFLLLLIPSLRKFQENREK